MKTAKDEILERVRDALSDLPPRDRSTPPPLGRDYQRSSPASALELVEPFIDRVSEYKATVRRVSAAELPAAIAGTVSRRKLRSLVIPADLPAEWIPAGLEVLRDPGLSNEQLDASGGVLTACALGIAQTGTIVLDGGAGQGRRALTLLPDYHLCVVRADQLVGVVPEGVARLREAASRPGNPITWISGPSATSDIELNRVEGVHGPRTLEVLVVG